MRIVKAWFLVTGATVLLAGVSSGCFLTPECTGCTDAATGGSGAGGGSAGSTTATIPDDEDCTNGADDDGDGDVDCADSDCTPDFGCIPEPPAGWQGLYDISMVDFAADLPACDDGEAPEVFFTEPTGPTTCSTCSCGALEGTDAKCSLPQILCYANSPGCSGDAIDWTALLSDGECHQPQQLGANTPLWCEIAGVSLPGGEAKCMPSGGKLLEDDPWKKQVGVCAVPTGSGCGAEQVCAATQSVANANCLRRDGDVGCPPGPFSLKTLVYRGEGQHRSCNACTCTPNCIGGSYTVHDRNNCNVPGWGDSAPITVDSDSGCKDVSQLLDSLGSTATWSMKANPPLLEGPCTAAGGEPQEDLNLAGPVTFCCRM